MKLRIPRLSQIWSITEGRGSGEYYIVFFMILSHYFRKFFAAPFLTSTFFVLRVCFRFFVMGKVYFFHECDFVNFHGENCFSRPLFCKFTEFFTGVFSFITRQIMKYRVFFSGAFSFFMTQKKKTL